MPYLSENKDGDTVLALYIQPKASQNRFCGLHGEEMKLAITAPPVEGKANKAVQAFVAKFFGVAKSAVILDSGQQSRHKRLVIKGIDSREARRRIEGQEKGG
ncbi:MAG: YggU family protein [Proteobacteria bacterium]|nr:YggU family protein [Pseudomonadota bacterium]MBU1639260.1 YggU family protein [Pseudomonadota bacterium]